MNTRKMGAALAAVALALMGAGIVAIPASATQYPPDQDECLITPEVLEESHVVTHPAVTEQVKVVDFPAVPSVWANFAPNDTQATFIGPAIWPTDARGTWIVHGQLPPGQAGPDGVYANGNPDKGGNWFYRHAEVPEVSHYVTVVIEEAWEETVIDVPYQPAVYGPCPPEEPETASVTWTYDNSCQDQDGTLTLNVVGAHITGFTWNGVPWQGDPNDLHAGVHDNPLAGQFVATYEADEGYAFPEGDDGTRVIDITHKTAQECEVPQEVVPDVPTSVDPCGLDNIEVSVPVDTDAVDYESHVNHWGATIVTATPKEGYYFPEGTTDWWKFKDSGERCLIPVPYIEVFDFCGEGNLWVYVEDGFGFDFTTTWNEDGSIDVEFDLLPDYAFDGEFALVQHFVEENLDECPVPEIVTPEPPVLVDPCGADNYTVTIPEDTEAYFYDSYTEGGITTVSVYANDGYVFDEEGNYYMDWSFEDSGEACPPPPPGPEPEPEPTPPSLSGTGPEDALLQGGIAAGLMVLGTGLVLVRRMVRG